MFQLLSSCSHARYESGDHVAVYPANDSSLVNQIGEILGTDLDTVMSLNNLDGEYRSPLNVSNSSSDMASVLPTRAEARPPSGPVGHLQANRSIPWQLQMLCRSSSGTEPAEVGQL